MQTPLLGGSVVSGGELALYNLQAWKLHEFDASFRPPGVLWFARFISEQRFFSGFPPFNSTQAAATLCHLGVRFKGNSVCFPFLFQDSIQTQTQICCRLH